MREFLKSNTVTYNLMSFTGFKAIQLFALLLEEPRSYIEMQQYLKTHVYLPEDISIDTLRIYINTLRRMGCNIKRITDFGITKYYIESHPFKLKITDSQAKSVLKLFKAISKSVDVSDLLALQNFLNKMTEYITNNNLKTRLKNASPIRNINPILIRELLEYAQNNNEITILYNSSASKTKNITLVADKLYLSNGKLYLSGVSSEHENYSSFAVSKIIKVVSVSCIPTTLEVPEITVGYEYKREPDEMLDLLKNEVILRKYKTKLIVEITSKNKFELMQRIMSLSPKCKILYPQDFKDYIITNLKKMKEGYIDG